VTLILPGFFISLNYVEGKFRPGRAAGMVATSVGDCDDCEAVTGEAEHWCRQQ
jgi:hypothetical protein